MKYKAKQSIELVNDITIEENDSLLGTGYVLNDCVEIYFRGFYWFVPKTFLQKED